MPKPTSKPPIVWCEESPEAKAKVKAYAEALRRLAHEVGDHNMSEEEFWDSHIFQGAIERLRGQQAARLDEKKAFVETVLDYLKQRGHVKSFHFVGMKERYDIDIKMSSGRNVAIEMKGCMDGNNTNIYQKPPHAEEFIIWSLCQNPTNDPRKNAWSGLHTRIGADLITKRPTIQGVVIWDMVCGTVGRPCPKLMLNPERGTKLVSGRSVPPPCICLLPRTIPDARNNPFPETYKLEESEFLLALWSSFNGDLDDIVQVRYLVTMSGPNIVRETVLFRNEVEFYRSRPIPIKRSAE